MISIVAGFIAGSIHVFSGPDHLAAVAPLSVRRKRGAWLTGLRWGIGHSAGVLLVGGLALLFRDLLPLDLISSWSERLVGVLLIGIGLWGLRKAFSKNLHSHAHAHNGEEHVHFHLHSPGEAHQAPEAHRHDHAAFGIGALHGLAGSSHFIGVLPALALPSTAGAIGYLGAYAVGTVMAMALFSSAVGLLSERWAIRHVKAYQGLLCGCSLVACFVGAYWLVVGGV
jgi:ABC-type nickel/cobalt efflux system permease component RcnA